MREMVPIIVRRKEFIVQALGVGLHTCSGSDLTKDLSVIWSTRTYVAFGTANELSMSPKSSGPRV